MVIYGDPIPLCHTSERYPEPGHAIEPPVMCQPSPALSIPKKDSPYIFPFILF